MTSEEIIAREADRLRALWGDPFAAPDMPPRTLLRQWLQTPPAEREPDLTAQITAHPLGPDAYSLLVLEPLLPPDPPLPPLSDKTRALMDQAWEQRDRTPRRPAPSPPAAPARGVLCRTTEKLEYFDPDRPLMQHRRTWQPQDILLTTGPWTEAGDTLWRAAAATPAALWPEFLREADDLPVTTTGGEEWIAHLWLEYPVSEAQIAATLATVDETSLENLELAGTALPDGLPLEDPEAEATRDPEVQLERDRLMARAGFLPATADARRVRAEWMADQPTVPAPEQPVRRGTRTFTPALLALIQQDNQLALAAGNEVTSLCMVFPRSMMGQPLNETATLFRSVAAASAIAGDDDAEWDLPREENIPALPDGVEFELASVTGAILGFGDVSSGIARLRTVQAQPELKTTGAAAILIFYF